MSPLRNIMLAALGTLSLAAFAADPRPASEVRERYLQERAACAHMTAEDRTTCLREAGAAQIEARRGTLLAEGENYERNLLQRCEHHKNAEDRDYCERRMRGEGVVTGSVEEGAVLRELTVVVPAN